MEKITKKDMFMAIRKMAEDGNMHIEDFAEGITDTMVVEFCDNEVEKLEKKAAKAKETAATKKAEGDALTAAVRVAMSTTDFESIADIAAKVVIEDEEVTASKVTYRLTNLVKAGIAEKEQITIPATDGNKARKVQAYRLASQDCKQ